MYVATLCVLSFIVVGMLGTWRVKIWCIRFSLCILSAEDIKTVLLLLTLEACRSAVNPPVLCSVVVP